MLPNNHPASLAKLSAHYILYTAQLSIAQQSKHGALFFQTFLVI